jgi:hypothetical protein
MGASKNHDDPITASRDERIIVDNVCRTMIRGIVAASFFAAILAAGAFAV